MLTVGPGAGGGGGGAIAAIDGGTGITVTGGTGPVATVALTTPVADSVTGTGFWYSAAGVLDPAAVTAGQDVAQGALTGGVVPLTVEQARDGVFVFGAGGTLTWSPASAPLLTQTAVATTPGANLTIAPQTSSNANATGGNLVVDLEAPTGTGTEAQFQIFRGGFLALQAGFGSGFTGGVECLWLPSPGPPTGLNANLASFNGVTYVNGITTVELAIGFAPQALFTASGAQLFGASDFGGGVGVLSLSPATTQPTALPASSTSLYTTLAGQFLGVNANGIVFPTFIAAPAIEQTALPSTGAGAGAAGAPLEIAAQAGQAATGAGNNGGAGGNLLLASGAGGTSGAATAGVPGAVELAPGGTPTVSSGAQGVGLLLASATLVLSGAGGTRTLTPAQYLMPLILCTGAITVSKTVVFPNLPGLWIVDISQVGNITGVNTLTFQSGTATTTPITTLTTNSNLLMVSTSGANGISINL